MAVGAASALAGDASGGREKFEHARLSLGPGQSPLPPVPKGGGGHAEVSGDALPATPMPASVVLQASREQRLALAQETGDPVDREARRRAVGKEQAAVEPFVVAHGVLQAQQQLPRKPAPSTANRRYIRRRQILRPRIRFIAVFGAMGLSRDGRHSAARLGATQL